jgi:hypothetical protein
MVRSNMYKQKDIRKLKMDYNTYIKRRGSKESSRKKVTFTIPWSSIPFQVVFLRNLLPTAIPFYQVLEKYHFHWTIRDATFQYHNTQQSHCIYIVSTHHQTKPA